MANKTNLSSWSGLKSYLSTYIDSTKDWDNEDLKDYTALSNAYANKKITGTQLAEGKTLLANYLADADASNTYNQAQASADNTARQANAYNNYINTRLSSYLGEMQGNAGTKGYTGLVQGQAVAVKNNQENAFKTTETNKRTALSDALSTYQKALTDNSAAAIGEQTTLAASNDAKIDADTSNYSTELANYIEKAKGDTGKISEANWKKAQDYIGTLDVAPETKTRLQNYLDLNYGSQVETAEDADAAKKTEITSTTSQADLDKVVEKMSDDEKSKYAAELQDQAKNMYKTSVKSGSASISSTFSINLKDGKTKGFNDDDTTVKVGSTYYDFDNKVCNSASAGQAVLVDGVVYVKLNNGRFGKVVDYAGNGAYDKLKSYLTGTYYAVSANASSETLSDRFNKFAESMEDVSVPGVSPY